MATLIPPEELLSLYSTGWFPMAMADGSIRCFSPDPRGILPLEAFHVPHGARKALRDPQWEVRQDTSFAQVIRACSHRPETWIDETIVQSYIGLHQAGHAHSLEIWRHGRLVGGLYGVIIGGAFFGGVYVSSCCWCFQSGPGRIGKTAEGGRVSAPRYSVDYSAPGAIRSSLNSKKGISASIAILAIRANPQSL